jgi:hypothetical protein
LSRYLVAVTEFRTWPTTRRLLKLSVAWFCSSVVLAPFAWGFSGALVWASTAESVRDAIGLAVVSAMVGPLYAAVIVLMLSIPYLAVLLAWPWCARRAPFIERSRRAILAAAIVLSLPAGMIVGDSRASSLAGFDQREFAQWFFMASFAGAVALAVPRMVFRGLRPGVFLTDSGELTP